MSVILGRYVARMYLVAVLSLLAGVVVLFLVGDFGDWLRIYVNRPWQDVAELYLWKAVVATQQFAPAAMLLGAGTAATLVRRRGEWVALQALGFSRAVILLPVAVVGLLLAAGLAWFDDQIVTRATTRIDWLMVNRFERWGDASVHFSPHRWFRVGDQILNVRGGAGPDGRLLDVSVHQVSPGFGLLRTIEAPELVPSGEGNWEAPHALQRIPALHGAPGEQAGPVSLVLPGATAETFRIQLGRPEAMPVAELEHQVRARQRVGLTTGRFIYALHHRFALPLGGLAGALVAALLVLRPGRKGALALALVEGAAVYVGLFVLSLAARALALGEHLRPWIAAWTPPALLVLGALALALKERAWGALRPGSR